MEPESSPLGATVLVSGKGGEKPGVRTGLGLGSQHQAQPSANWVLDLVGPGAKASGASHMWRRVASLWRSHTQRSVTRVSRLRGPALATFSLNLPDPEATALFLS